ncbi:MAG: glycoside hydrolase, partial [Actinomycetota bacterium]|nr:glycoside hydrolase [Actinomycetota bacterium]
MRNLHRAAVVAAAATMATPLLVNADTARAGTPTADPDASGCTGSVPFVSGEGGYAVYRIPAVVRAADGAVVAFAEARESSSDAGSIDLV